MAKKDHRIRARDDKGQQREIQGYGAWKPWRAPKAWTPELMAALEHRPGVYMVRAVTAPQTPLEFAIAMTGGGATADQLKKRAAPLQGVLYIGKAVDLTTRFGTLAFSWQIDPPVRAHTSAKNFSEERRRVSRAVSIRQNRIAVYTNQHKEELDGKVARRRASPTFHRNGFGNITHTGRKATATVKWIRHTARPRSAERMVL